MIKDRSQFSMLIVEFFKPQSKVKPPVAAPALRYFDLALAEMLASAARPGVRISPRRA